jgi:Flp pilus assembly protein TadD
MRRPRVTDDLWSVGVRDSFSLLSLYAGGPRELAKLAAEARVQTDDRATLEYSAPRAIYGASRGDNVRLIRALVASPDELPDAIRSARASATPGQWRSRGLMLLRAEAFSTAFDDLARASRADPDDGEALSGLTRAAARARRLDDGLATVRAIAAAHPGSVPVRVALSRLLMAKGDPGAALDAARAAVDLDRGSAAAREQLASVLADMEDAEGLASIVDLMRAERPGDPATLYYDATLRFMAGDLARAAELGERVIRAEPDHARAHNLLGAAYATLGEGDRARASFQAAVRADPEDPAAHVNLATFELRAGNPSAAASHFAQALLIEPRSPAALGGLAESMDALGRPDRAAALRARQAPGM